MIILTNGLTDVVDEGFLKVANSLVKRLKAKHSQQAMVVTYDRKSDLSDVHLQLNKLFLNKSLFSAIRSRNDDLLFVPFPAREWATALRVFILSLMCRKKITVVLAMLCKCNFIGSLLFKLSGATIVTFSESAKPIYENMIGGHRVEYIKTGVDTKRFIPVSDDIKKTLKKKYGFCDEKPVILHVGHMKSGRNIAELMKFNSNYQIALVVSTSTLDEQDEYLKEELNKKENIKIIDEYLPNIQEIYQLSDLYFFPVLDKGNCIDIPLSCLEAASCNIPVLTTGYGEMKAFEGKSGFWFIENFSSDYLNDLAESALKEKNVNSREQILPYDWQNAIGYFEDLF